MNLGNIFLRQGRIDAATRELEKALKIDPTYGVAHHNLAYAYFRTKMYHLAWEHLQESKRLGVTPNPALEEALSALLQQEEERREKRF